MRESGPDHQVRAAKESIPRTRKGAFTFGMMSFIGMAIKTANQRVRAMVSGHSNGDVIATISANRQKGRARASKKTAKSNLRRGILLLFHEISLRGKKFRGMLPELSGLC